MAGKINEVLTSTNYNPKYNLESLFKSFQVTRTDGEIDYRRDYLGSDTARLLKSIKGYAAVTYDGTVPLTTLVNKLYGNTTVTPLVTMYNGIHALELVPGRIIKFPDLTSLDERLRSETIINNIGKTVTI